MEICDICCNNLNKTSRKKVECLRCNMKACRACCQGYILSKFEDPHCMNCKSSWSRIFIDSFCTKQFRIVDYKNHRENVLLEKEKALMPQTQPEVEKVLLLRKLQARYKTIREKLVDLHQRYRTYETGNIPPDVLSIYRDMELIHHEINRIKNQNTDTETRRTFIRQCPGSTCKGFLDQEYYCSLCMKHFCSKCGELKEGEHVCDPDTVATMKLLYKDSKGCPGCGVVLHKIDGCDQMWCTSCHTTFSWKTRRIQRDGRIHNPHFIEHRHKERVSMREHGDIPCGGTPSFRELRIIEAPNAMLEMSFVFQTLERSLLYMDIVIPDNLETRISYMLNELPEDYFKEFLQRQEKFYERQKDIYDIYETVCNAGGDILRQYVMDQRNSRAYVELLKKLISLANQELASVRSRYNCSIPKNILVVI